MINPPQMHRATRRPTEDELKTLAGLLMEAFPAPNVGDYLAHCGVMFAPEQGQTMGDIAAEIVAHVRREFRLNPYMPKTECVFTIITYPDMGEGAFMLANDRDAYIVRVAAMVDDRLPTV